MKISFVYYYPETEYKILVIESSKPLLAYSGLYSILRDILEIKRSAFFDRDIRFDATDNSFFIRCEATKRFGNYLPILFLEFIISGKVPKEGKEKVEVKYRAKLSLEIEEKGILKEILLYFFFNFWLKKRLEEYKEITKKVVEEIKERLVKLLS
jgi:hypothetical protein